MADRSYLAELFSLDGRGAVVTGGSSGTVYSRLDEETPRNPLVTADVASTELVGALRPYVERTVRP